MPAWLLPAIFGIGTAANIYGQVKAGKAAERTAAQQAKQLQIDRIVSQAQAAQNMTNRYESYEDAMSQSNAIFLGGMETAQETFESSQRKILVSDIKTMSTMSTLQSGQSSIASAIEIQRGKNARKASYYQAIGTIGTAAYQYSMIS
jgi:hypothetical protein